MNMPKHFAKKSARGFIKLACTVKFLLELDKLLHKLAKNIKFIKSVKTMKILHDKSNMSLTTLLFKSDMSLTIIKTWVSSFSTPTQ